MVFHTTARINEAMQGNNHFIKEMLKLALNRNEADALRDTEMVAELLRERADIFFMGKEEGDGKKTCPETC